MAFKSAAALATSSSARRRSVTSSIASTKQFAVVAGLELPGVEEHDAPPDDGEGVDQLEVVEDRAFGHHVLQKPPQVGDVPLPVAQFVDEAVSRSPPG